ncbi:DNA polymerase ligase N-terminal domain-containing protein [Achromobacter aegrifaciens]|uniref:DNA polymerase ligase N-terminal domain-containing protein n=1 Tax=Achromobacter aegrifaciens TaxID=1287736 RepID=UPI002165A538|nr:DNA polymerase ligase N-terminal domain-containing protein [Achromobacter aegrifaciens]
MKRWTVINGVPLDSQARRIAVEQTPSPAVGRSRKGRGVLLRRSGEPVHEWDTGCWYPVGDASGYEMGHLRFTLRGAILRGRWALVRMSGRGPVLRPPWLLIFTAP